MESKLIIFIIFIVFSSSCKSQNIQGEVDVNTSIYSKEELKLDRINSKKYALCSCLKSQNFIYSDSLLNDHSTNVYVEKGLKHINFYKELSFFTKNKIEEINYKSFKGDKVTLKMAECVDFFTSKELEEFILSIENKNYNE